MEHQPLTGSGIKHRGTASKQAGRGKQITEFGLGDDEGGGLPPCVCIAQRLSCQVPPCSIQNFCISMLGGNGGRFEGGMLP